VRLAPAREEAAAGAPGLGDRVLVRFERLETGEIEARLIKRLGQSAHRLLAVVRKGRGEIRLEPVDRRSKETLVLESPTGRDLSDGDLVLVRPKGGEAPHGRRRESGRPRLVSLIERVGREDHPRAASLIAIHTHGLVIGFSEAALAEAECALPSGLAGRRDLRAAPFVTIDPEDARDHDDAVMAEVLDGGAGGYVVTVAIADVAAFVRLGSALDREAWTKGNSVYFPDRVEPMLPEALSAGLCSLSDHVDRAVVAVRMVFDADGRKLSHSFFRAMIRSQASLSYSQAQRAADGDADAAGAALTEGAIRPLFAAYAALKRAREARSPLEIESPERRIRLNQEGEVVEIAPRERLEAHRLIEEMMIQANVCAAETLELRRTPLLYRIHDTPSEEKVRALADFLETVGLSWSKGESVRTDRFNRLLEAARDTPNQEIVNEVVLRTQMQAVYSPDNIGHFGLNLARYAHFTSPIRRYADLIVHRGLIRALGLGEDGLSDAEIARLEATADHVTATERAAMAAERDAADRYVAAFLEDRVGAVFTGKVTGVTRFGLFIRLSDSGADGLAPVSSLGAEYFEHDERGHALVGAASGRGWRLGAAVEVRLREATPVTGGLLFEVLTPPDPLARPRPKGGRALRAAPPHVGPKRRRGR
jgi:ribonuclease R